MGDLQPWHIAIILLVFVVFFGYKKLPDASRSIGRSLRIFKAETKGLVHDNDAPSADAAPTAPAAIPAPVQTPVAPPAPVAAPTPVAPAAPVSGFPAQAANAPSSQA